MLSVDICDSNGQTSNYLLATDNHRHLFFIQQGSVVLVLNTPAVITAVRRVSVFNHTLVSLLEPLQPVIGLFLVAPPLKSGATYLLTMAYVGMYVRILVNFFGPPQPPQKNQWISKIPELFWGEHPPPPFPPPPHQ